MRNDELITSILNGMYKSLDSEQMNLLKSVLNINLGNKIICDNSTELSLDSSETNESVLKKFVMSYQLNHSQNTVKQYYYSVFKLLTTTQRLYSDISTCDIEAYLSQMKLNGASGTYLDNTKRNISSFYKWAYKKHYILINPCEGLDKIQRNAIKKVVISDYEMAEIRDNVISSDNNQLKKLRDLALLDFLHSTGVRVGELISLKDSNIDLEKAEVNVYAQKTGKWRITYLNANAIKHYSDYRKYLKENGIESEYAFININKRNGIYSRMNENSVEHIIQQYSNGKRLTVHNFRKTLGSNLARKGVPIQHIQKVLGHSDIGTTMKSYVLVDDNDVKYSLSKHM